MRFFIKLAYDGTSYHGWQKQENAHTVQAELEEKLSLMLGEKIEVTGCGRTDAGVHASEFYAHFDAEKLIFSPKDTVYKLNRFLPDDIAVFKIFKVDYNKHARFDAISRTYKYYINTVKNPFKTKFSYFLPQKPGLKKMNIAANFILEYEDFTSFSKLHTQTYTNNCKVFEARWDEHDNGDIVFTIKADRFLRNMVRAVVGTLLEIGKGKMEPEKIKEIIEAKDRGKAGFSVPAHGLFLTKIEYDFL